MSADDGGRAQEDAMEAIKLRMRDEAEAVEGVVGAWKARTEAAEAARDQAVELLRHANERDFAAPDVCSACRRIDAFLAALSPPVTGEPE